jgi:hypothetical protein
MISVIQGLRRSRQNRPSAGINPEREREKHTRNVRAAIGRRERHLARKLELFPPGGIWRSSTRASINMR